MQQQPVYTVPAGQPQPIAGYTIVPPQQAPNQGDVLVGWEVIQPDDACSCDLNTAGFVTLIILVFVFWPLFWIPMVCASCKNPRQRPIYGPPGSVPPAVMIPMPMPTAAPVQLPGRYQQLPGNYQQQPAAVGVPMPQAPPPKTV